MDTEEIHLDYKTTLLNTLDSIISSFFHTNKLDEKTSNCERLLTSQPKITKKGTLIYDINEQYLSNETNCGYTLCNQCTNNKILSEKPILILDLPLMIALVDSISRHNIFNNIVLVETLLNEMKSVDSNKYKIYVELSSNIHQLESDEKKIRYNCEDSDKVEKNKVYVFSNMFFSKTFSDSNSYNSINDYLNSTLIKTFDYYNNHINAEVYLLTANEISCNEIKASYKLLFGNGKSSNILSIDEYKNKLQLDSDLFYQYVNARLLQNINLFEEQEYYPDYIEETEIVERLIRNEIYEGNLNCTKSPFIGYINMSTPINNKRKINIIGAYNINRACNGDKVYVAIIDNSDQYSKNRCAITDELNNSMSINHLTSNGDVELPEDELYGYVIGVIKKENRKICGTIKLEDKCYNGTNMIKFIPVDVKLPPILLYQENFNFLINKRLVVIIDEWPTTSIFPIGHWIDILGNAFDMETELNVILSEHNFDIGEFNRKALAELPKEDFKIPISEIEKRLDLRLKYCVCDLCNHKIKLPTKQAEDLSGTPMLFELYDSSVIGIPRPLANINLMLYYEKVQKLRMNDVKFEESSIDSNNTGCLVFSIDPNTCVDIDDALSIRFLPNAHYEIGVHIADVSYFVKNNSELDKEAFRRATTLYMVSKRIDMLPTRLSSNISSLKSGHDRLAISVFWEIDENGKIYNTTFHKTIIHSVAAFNYLQGQQLLESQEDNYLTVRLKLLNKIAKNLRRNRIAGGSVELASMQVSFKFDKYIDTNGTINYTNKLADMSSYKIYDTHKMVEEFMLLANASAAELIIKKYPNWSILRTHPPPITSRMEDLADILKSKNIDIFYGTNKEFADSLNTIAKTKNAHFDKIIRMMAVQCMNRAIYVCSGKIKDYELFKHYALGLKLYTHFTSPIRRYADILVHRLISASIQYDSVPMNTINELSKKCDYINKISYAAKQCQIQTNKYFTYCYYEALSNNNMHRDLSLVCIILELFSFQMVVQDIESGIQLVVLFDMTKYKLQNKSIISIETNDELNIFDYVNVSVLTQREDNRYEIRAELISKTFIEDSKIAKSIINESYE